MTNRSLYYDRSGHPIGMREWSVLHADMGYKIVARDELNGWLVSTVWLGIDHNFTLTGKPVIFETMVFAPDPCQDDGYQERYTTEDEALQGHQAALAWTRGQIGTDEYSLRVVPVELGE